MKIRCRLGWHGWGQWAVAPTSIQPPNTVVEWGALQVSRCADCRLQRSASYGNGGYVGTTSPPIIDTLIAALGAWREGGVNNDYDSALVSAIQSYESATGIKVLNSHSTVNS